MKLGMYSLEIQRPTAEGLFDAIGKAGFSQVQFDFASVCSEQMPLAFADGRLAEIRRLSERFGVEIAAVNGTFNMIHPDKAEREDGIKRFASVAAAASELNCGLVTLCTGSRNRGNMWAWHEDNSKSDAWDDLLASTEKTLEEAERFNLTLGIECEPNNCINSAEKARKLLDEFRSPRLKIIMDIANLFAMGQARKGNVRPVMDNAFALLGDDICLAHGKDIKEGDGLDCTYAGNGIVDFDYFLDKLEQAGYKGGMILHGMKHEREFPESVAFLNGVFANRRLS